MKTIQLTCGAAVLVDDADYEFLSQWVWRLETHGYPHRREMRDGKKRIIMLHRVVLGLTDPSIMGDHIDGNPLNNQRANLRSCTRAENNRNRATQKNCRSGFKGVFRAVRAGVTMWRAQIRFGGAYSRSPFFATATDAAEWYDKMAMEHHGPFAKTNASLGLLGGCESRRPHIGGASLIQSSNGVDSQSPHTLTLKAS